MVVTSPACRRRSAGRISWNVAYDAGGAVPEPCQDKEIFVTVRELLDGVSCLSLRSVALAVSKPSELRSYTSYCLKRYEELAGKGLPSRSPVVQCE